ncbi:SDR family NAD(P)-dependent oxidoreductase [Streptomyces niveus]|uniref:SDR family NAD(P)-dependent oxidoreductase n=1 Tax=Streptomyces niveus TaxID=193462 RepID=UPI0036C00915
MLDADYWYRNLRGTVEFDATVRLLLEDGFSLFVESSPHPVLSVAVGETVEEVGAAASVVGTLRRDEGGWRRFLTSAATAWTHGARTDWDQLNGGTAVRPADLPTYAFQRQRYWLDTPALGGDTATLGLSPADHPLLGAAVELADSDGLLLTGRLTPRGHPWLTDHTAADTFVLTPAALLELALHAAEHAGCRHLEQLTLEEPLALPDDGTTQIQLAVGAPDPAGRRHLTLHARAETTGTDGEEQPWTRHATGTVSPSPPGDAPTSPASWPPPDATPVDLGTVRRAITASGLGTGPAFEGLTGVWSDRDRLYAEVTLPDSADDASGYHLHPALLDAALHPLHTTAAPTADGTVRLVRSWHGVTLHARGQTTVRVALTPTPDDRNGLSAPGHRLQIWDGAGTSVATVDTVTLGAVPAAGLRTLRPALRNALFGLDWAPIAPPSAAPAPTLRTVGEGQAYHDLEALAEAVAEGAPLPDAVFVDLPGHSTITDDELPHHVGALTEWTADLLTRWLAETRLLGSRLALRTSRAVRLPDDPHAPDPAAAAARGLVRAAQHTYPDRFVLVDTDGTEASETALGPALTTTEDQIALRAGTVHAARLVRLVTDAAPPARAPGPAPEATGTVLVTGTPGPFAVPAAVRLAVETGARRVLCPPGTVLDERESYGIELASHDGALPDHELVGTLLGGPDPLCAVLHAGSPSGTDLADTVTAAWKLHTAVTDLPDLRAFVLFSSADGILGEPGSGAAEAAFFDALATLRQARGLAGTAYAWGPSAPNTELPALTPEHAAALFGAAQGPVTAGRPLVLAAHLPPTLLRARQADGALSPVLRGLLPQRAEAAGASALARRLTGTPEEEWPAALLALVRERAAAVLGHADPAAIAADRPFRELGFDSLTAVELRNHLGNAIGMRLPATLVFDHPTPQAVAGHLLTRVTGPAPTPAPEALAAGAADDPVAIVAIGCRYPGGVTSPEELWELLAQGTDAIGDFPTDRGWDVENLHHPDPGHPGTTYTRRGGFVYDAADFDADFFGISPREATAMDPQQRLLLETAWETFERAGIDPLSLRETRTGVFIGSSSQDYATLLAAAPESTEGYLLTGTSASVLSGRVSYLLGLEGPAVTVDTACSSSLVALHLAAQALRNGECSLALTGGVAVLATPAGFVEFSRQRGLSEDGRCKAFSADADGTGWGEGVGLLLLERLSDAERHGHEVLALVRGSATNQDGASNGLTAPNGPAQERVIRQALASARLSPAEVDAVEAHGTGTTLGDPIEAHALLGTYGQERTDGEPLWLGSLKSNIGHTQAAAGVGGVIKMVLAMRHGILPRTLHVGERSPHVDWSSGAVELLDESRDWPVHADRPRRSAVSAFGISGTNAHVVLEAPAPEVRPEPTALPEGTVVPWVLSGRSVAALRGQAARLVGWAGEGTVADVGLTLATERSRLPFRAAVVGESVEDFRTGLQALAAGESAPGLSVGSGGGRSGGLAFLFAGQGSQRPGMGRELAEAFPVFAESFAEVCEAFDGLTGAPLLEALDDDRVHGTGFAQPALFAFEVALFRLWESWGVRPEVMAGHSVGEFAAAHVAGVFSLEDAARLVAARGRLMQELPTGGGMLAVRADEATVAPLLSELVSVAAVNGPESVVLSGDSETLDKIAGTLNERGTKTRKLTVSHAFHSPLMDPVLDAFREVAETVTYSAPRIPLVSTLTGAPATGGDFVSADYWVDHARQAVRFHDAVRALDGSAFVEIGPDATLTTLARTAGDAVSVPSLRPGLSEAAAVVSALAQLHVEDVTQPDWQAVFGPHARTVDLPTYAFQRQRHWLDASAAVPGDAAGLGLAPEGHPLLGATLDLAGGHGTVATGRLSHSAQPWLADHALHGTPVLPGAALVELALHLADLHGSPGLAEIALTAPLPVPERGTVQLQAVTGEADAAGQRTLTVHARPSRPDDTTPAPWTPHAAATFLPPTSEIPAPPDVTAWPPPGAVPVPVAELDAALAAAGYEHGPALHGVQALWRADATLCAEVTLPDTTFGDHALHPALLDAALQPLALRPTDDGTAHGVTVWHGVRLHAVGATTLRVLLTPAGITLTDPAGQLVLTAESVTTAPLPPLPAPVPRDGLLTAEWSPVALPAPQPGTYVEAAVLGADPLGLAADGARAHPGLDALTAAVRAGDPSPALVYAHLAGSSGTAAAEGGAAQVHAHTVEALELVQQWLRTAEFADSRLVITTRYGATVRPGEPIDATVAGARGLVRSALSEHPGRFLLLDCDEPGTLPEPSTRPGPAILLGLATAHDEHEWALRDGTPHRLRLRPLPPAENAESFENAESGADTAPDPDGTVLVTGGTGALGRLVARHLVTAHGARHLLLTSRTGPEAPGVAELVAELGRQGARVTVVACDAADRTALGALLDSIPSRHPLTAVVHTAGVLDDGLVDALTAERLRTVLRPKTDAAWHLHDLTRTSDLRQFVLFSSASATLGGPGQANYAAANASLDALAALRRSLGLPAVSLAWGMWDVGGGMAAGLSETDRARLARGGLAPISATTGMELFDSGRAAAGPALLLPVPLHTPALRRLAAAGELAAPLRGLVRNKPRAAAVERTAPTTLREQLAGAAPAERERAVVGLVQQEVAAVLGHRQPVAADRSFKELGFDSLTAVELRNRVNAAAGLALPTTLVFDHPTPVALTRLLLSELAPTELVPTPTEGTPTSALAQLAGLEAALAELPDDPGLRERITTRLDTLAALWRSATEDPTETVRIDEASVDEVFDFIDRELRTPSDN